jgi:hypothetical protein
MGNDRSRCPKSAMQINRLGGVADGTRTHDDQNHNLGPQPAPLLVLRPIRGNKFVQFLRGTTRLSGRSFPQQLRNGMLDRGAVISECGRYRYILWMQWGYGGWVNFCCLNPSTADATKNDPSFTRMVNFAKAWGYDGLAVTNLFAFRATNPQEMRSAPDPVGPNNDGWLRFAWSRCAITVAGWGALGGHRGRDAEVRATLPRLHYLRLTKDGHPGHPLYLSADLRPTPWTPV